MSLDKLEYITRTVCYDDNNYSVNLKEKRNGKTFICILLEQILTDRVIQKQVRAFNFTDGNDLTKKLDTIYRASNWIDEIWRDNIKTNGYFYAEGVGEVTFKDYSRLNIEFYTVPDATNSIHESGIFYFSPTSTMDKRVDVEELYKKGVSNSWAKAE